MTYVKHLVSKKKRRYMEDGFDLDLSYIKPNIIAMGFPAENLEGVYRNHSDEVVRFLEMKHRNHYKNKFLQLAQCKKFGYEIFAIGRLHTGKDFFCKQFLPRSCSERSYDPSKFCQRVSHYGFDDHNAPPFELIEPFCLDMDRWLSADDANVAIVHCKAGKGRTGVMICAYLLYKRYFTDPQKAMAYYGDARTNNNKGVTIPSQRRYIEYYGSYVRNNWEYEPKALLLRSITFKGIPNFNNGTCSPAFTIYQTKVILFKSKHSEIKRNEEEGVLILTKPLPICGDIKVDFLHKEIFRKERMFVFWFNTYFVERGVTSSKPDGGDKIVLGTTDDGEEVRRVVFKKDELDKANKDKKNKFFPPNFEVHLTVIVPKCTDSTKIPSSSKDSKKTVLLPPTNADKTSSAGRRSPRSRSVPDLIDAPPSSTAPVSRLTSVNESTLSNSDSVTSNLDRSASRSLEGLTLAEENLSDTDEEDNNWQACEAQLHVTRV